MNDKLVSLSILFILILLLFAKHLNYHLYLIIFLSVLLIYLIYSTYLDNETFYTQCGTQINIDKTNIDSNILQKIMDKLSKFN